MSMRSSTGTAGQAKATQRALRGFSLLELVFSVALLLIVTGAIFDQIIAMQRKSAAESMKVDSSQEAREFVDQMVRDIHMAGYPSASMYAANPDDTKPWVAAGLVKISPTQITLEGDVNNEGVVYSVTTAYVASDPGDANCPCIRRSALPKVAADPLSQPVSPYYTETAHVLPPGAGGTAEDLFAFYDQSGNKLPVSGGVDLSTPGPGGTQPLITLVRTVKINLTLLTTKIGAGPGEATAQTSLTATARLNQ
jgi:type II secretory pathway pseudopilin PulG